MAAPPGGEERRGATGLIATVGVGVFAVVCCAGLPLITGLVGGLTVAGVLGVGTGLLVAAAAVAAVALVVRSRQRRACELPTPHSPSPPAAGEPMKIEVLYFDGCPNHEAFLPRLRELLDRAGVDDEICLRRVESLDAAERERFLGSPTVRMDGRDVEPGAERRADFGLKCRLYRTANGVAGQPADEWIAAALRRARP
jgi:hypothetical protein